MDAKENCKSLLYLMEIDSYSLRSWGVLDSCDLWDSSTH